MRKKLLPLGRLFESAWYNPILKAVPMSMGILMSGNAGYAIAGNMSDNVVIVQQQTICVTGTVIDASGEPLVGVNIVEAGTVNGVISDFEGKFTLNVKPNATLKISYIGYIAQNILVKGQKNLTITLQEDTETLDEVVVVGYGTVRKAALAGVNVVSDGVPGGSVKIRIRGTNSINKSNDPLYVVDGMVRESGLEGINPEDIQSMQILKDASSTAIYGSRGANGVVIITTKSGVKGQTNITFDASVGISQATNLPKMMDTKTYAQALVDYAGISASEVSDYLDGSIPVLIGRIRCSVQV